MLSALGLIFAGHFFTGLLSIILGSLGVRVSFELVYVSFSINRHLENLVEWQSTPTAIKENKQPKAPPPNSEA